MAAAARESRPVPANAAAGPSGPPATRDAPAAPAPSRKPRLPTTRAQCASSSAGDGASVVGVSCMLPLAFVGSTRCPRYARGARVVSGRVSRITACGVCEPRHGVHRWETVSAHVVVGDVLLALVAEERHHGLKFGALGAQELCGQHVR